MHHYVPKNGATTNFNHRLWAHTRFLSESGPFTTGKYCDFHCLAQSQDAKFNYSSMNLANSVCVMTSIVGKELRKFAGHKSGESGVFKRDFSGSIAQTA
ncbi:MAG: hypothetical protein OEM91_00660 [Hyphomicrobiales bacterium]|nr:hypothetical protein [Hyphomicrobiales bacterium]